MKFNYRLAGLSGLVVLSACFSARAQASAGASVQSQLTSPAESAAAQLSRYAAAHDSLQRRVTSIHTQAEARLGLFQAATGTLRRKVKSYAGRKGPVVQDDGTQSALAVVKQQSTKRRFGVELERVTYYDPLGRKVLKELYAEHQLTRLELFEYLEPINVPTIKWLFVRGDYLSCTEKKLASDKKVSYYFSPRPAVE